MPVASRDAPPRRRPNATGTRAGLTLVELLVAAAVMAIVVAALAFLAKAVYVSADYSGGHGEAVQHARVTLERITRLANEATTSPEFPGMLVLAKQQDGYQYPDTLVLWHPSSKPIDPAGLPRFNELIIFCAKAGRPNELIELTAPGDTRTAPACDDSTAWSTEIEALRNSGSTRQTVLTDLLRTALIDNTASPDSRRPCVRFNLRLRPSDADLAGFEEGDVEWEDLPWVQNIYSHALGLRQVWLRIELQLLPGHQARNGGGDAQTAIPFFDSATVHYTLRNDDD